MTTHSTSLRECRLYRFYVAHPLTGDRVLGYVGETGRLPLARLMEHVQDQPWADTIIGWEVDPVVYPGKTAVLAAETAAIRAERPLYNVLENRGNPARIPPPTAIRQRRNRDAQRGRPPWVHPDDRPGAERSPRGPAVPRPRTGQRPAARRRARAARVKAGLWAGSGLTVWIGLWIAVAHVGLWATWTSDAITAAVTTVLILAWAAAGAPITRRQRRRAANRIRRKAGLR